jgi:hypothetical protein
VEAPATEAKKSTYKKGKEIIHDAHQITGALVEAKKKLNTSPIKMIIDNLGPMLSEIRKAGGIKAFVHSLVDEVLAGIDIAVNWIPEGKSDPNKFFPEGLKIVVPSTEQQQEYILKKQENRKSALN